jgi:hypothetical protein
MVFSQSEPISRIQLKHIELNNRLVAQPLHSHDRCRHEAEELANHFTKIKALKGSIPIIDQTTASASI